MKNEGVLKHQNPFTNGSNYSDFIYRQVKGMTNGKDGAIKIDIGSKDFESARMTLRYVASKHGGKYKTKTFKGDLWVMKYAG